jgi:hypothetical protein
MNHLPLHLLEMVYYSHQFSRVKNCLVEKKEGHDFGNGVNLGRVPMGRGRDGVEGCFSLLNGPE